MHDPMQETENIVDRMFSGAPLTDEVWDGRTERFYDVIDHDGNILVQNVSHEAALNMRDLWSIDFGGVCDIIETKTILRDGTELFSEEKTYFPSHDRSHAPIDDPMMIEFYSWDMEVFAKDLSVDVDPSSYDPSIPTNNLLPTSHPKPTKKTLVSSDTKVVERRYQGSATLPEEVLIDRGYHVIDKRDARIIYTGTKSMVKNFLDTRMSKSIRKSDRLTIPMIKIIRYTDFDSYRNDLNAHGFVAMHGYLVIGYGARDDLSPLVKEYIKEKKVSDPKKNIRIERIGA